MLEIFSTVVPSNATAFTNSTGRRKLSGGIYKHEGGRLNSGSPVLLVFRLAEHLNANPALHPQGHCMCHFKTECEGFIRFPTRENIWNHETAGRVVFMFSSVWKPDETRSTSFWNYFSKETIQNYAVSCFSHLCRVWIVVFSRHSFYLWAFVLN